MATKAVKSDDTFLSAWVTFRVRMDNICTKQDLIDTDMTLREMIETLISEDGIYGLVDVITSEHIVKVIQEKGVTND